MSTCLINQQQIKQDNLELKTQNKTLKDENIELRKQITLLDIASRKNNLKMWGIFEAHNENKFDCNRKFISILQRIGISLHPQAISQAHRLGPKTRNKVPRVMLVTFINTDDKDFVLNKAKVLSMHFRIRIESDLPQAMEDQRKELRPIVVAANKIKDEKGNNKYRASLQQDTIIVNNRTYDVNSAKHLPRELTLEMISTPSYNGITGFFTKKSPLSNHYPATFKIKGKTYNCSEQYYMEQMALTFGDVVTAKKIMAEKEAGAQKKLSYEISGFKQLIWEEMRVEIMQIGIAAKFGQNKHLQEFLLNTGTNALIEANPKDKFWGAGMSLKNPYLWKKNSTLGYAENKLGQMLMDLRRDFKRAK